MEYLSNKAWGGSCEICKVCQVLWNTCRTHLNCMPHLEILWAPYQGFDSMEQSTSYCAHSKCSTDIINNSVWTRLSRMIDGRLVLRHDSANLSKNSYTFESQIRQGYVHHRSTSPAARVRVHYKVIWFEVPNAWDSTAITLSSPQQRRPYRAAILFVTLRLFTRRFSFRLSRDNYTHTLPNQTTSKNLASHIPKQTENNRLFSFPTRRI